jgi:Mce-associated membrane protein
VAVPSAPAPSGELTDSSSATTFRFALLIGLVVVLLTCVGLGAWLTVSRGAPALGVEGKVGQRSAELEQVRQQTEQFLLRMGNYGPDLVQDGKMPEYRTRVDSVITPKLATSFDDSVNIAEQQAAQGVGRTADVFGVGVSSIDPDSAVALIAGSFTPSFPDKKGKTIQGEPVPFRLEVNLVKSGGRWLVDNFAPVTGAATDGQSGGGALPGGTGGTGGSGGGK